MISLRSLVSACIDAGERAGREIVRIQNELGVAGMQVKTKSGPQDPVTIADVTGEQLIKSTILREFPGLTIVGEESAAVTPQDDQPRLNLNLVSLPLPEVPMNELILWVDPLDGTLEFVEGRLQFVTVLLGISRGGRPIAGVLHQPFVGRTVYGAPGYGVVNIPPPVMTNGDVCTVAVTFARGNPDLYAMMHCFDPTREEKVGGSGTKGLALLDGQVHLWVVPHTKSYISRWDTCAVEAMLEAMGGSLTDVWGDRYEYTILPSYYNTRGLIAASPDGKKFITRYQPPPRPLTQK